MSFMDWLSIISGVMGIAGTTFAILMWYRAETKIHTWTRAMQSIHKISTQAAFDSQVLPGEDARTRLTHLEQAISKVSTLPAITGEFVKSEGDDLATELGENLPNRTPWDWIWTQGMIDRVEMSSKVRHVWLVTPDLEPDLSEPDTGQMVRKNLNLGKEYTYFYPARLPFAKEQIARMIRNIGADDPKHRKKVRVVPIGNDAINIFPSIGNIILFFRDDPNYGTKFAFQEVVVNKSTRRGSFWQECTREHAAALSSTLLKHVNPGIELH